MKRPLATLFAGLAGLAAALLLPAGCDLRGPVALGPGEISAPDAWGLAERGELTIVDVRTPREWRQTGVAAGALEINMQQPRGVEGFVDKVLAAVDGNRSAPLGLICRTGNRSGQVQAVLRNAGFTQVYNIPEGMAGSRAGPGWLRRDLPVEAPRGRVLPFAMGR